jgi:predicted ATPase
LAEQALDLAQRSQDPLKILVAHHAMGLSLFFLGEWQQARMHLEQVITSSDPEQQRSLSFLLGWNPMQMALSFQAWVLWTLGYPNQALNLTQEAVAFARELDHPFSLAYALLFGCRFHWVRRDPQAVQRYAEEAMRLSTEGGFPLFQAWAAFLLGWARARQGEAEEGIAQMLQGLASWRSLGMESGVTSFLDPIAEAYGIAGQAEKGLALVEEALALVERTAERAWEAEVHRIKGELLLLSSRASEAEACFRQAIEVARRQEAKSYELCATISLSRLLQKQGRSAEARQLLSEIYAWFTEGFDTPDLKEAKALLDEL